MHMDIELFFAAVEFKVVRYSPRVPAGAASAEGHFAFGNFFA
jgi:hypothetical protein